ncbi:hypothetical protein [Rudaea cellulosilytica]|uniref:hypothetical protein n=1 Tax=Rudaea cellulosilytica TaxID=540746 RepID=UPI00037F0BF6|nr:hypothetical protein [Rudaea cellulosilytica]
MIPKSVPGLRLFAVALALGLLVATLVWRIPFMLWDHLDLAPMYAGWQNGTLAQTIFYRIHGGHLHTAAYVVLLATTWLSHGQTWLDCLASWVLLCGYAAIVFAICRETLHMDDARARVIAALVIFFALYPGHLANLQWGWQVAVFLCLFGSAATIRLLTAAELDWKGNLRALLAAALALLSFGTALALLPVALFAIAVRSESSVGRRIGLAVPWMACGLAAAYTMSGGASFLTQYVHAGEGQIAMALLRDAHYALNYLGAGVARFAAAAAPWLALFALVSGAVAMVATRHRRAARPWAALMLFGAASAFLTALARVDEGAAQAFVSRYVSFSSVFWMGWTGLCAVATQNTAHKPRAQSIALGVVIAFALLNAGAMTKRAARLANEAHAQAAILCATWPQVDHALLQGMHYDGADAALRGLQAVHALGFAPFDGCTPDQPGYRR